MLQLRFADLQVLSHAIERFDQNPDFIVRSRGNPKTEIAGGDRLGTFRKLLDRYGDALGDLKPKPGAGEDDDQRDADDQGNVLCFDRILVGFGLFEVSVGFQHTIHFRHEGFRQIRVHHHHARRFAGRFDRWNRHC